MVSARCYGSERVGLFFSPGSHPWQGLRTLAALTAGTRTERELNDPGWEQDRTIAIIDDADGIISAVLGLPVP